MRSKRMANGERGSCLRWILTCTSALAMLLAESAQATPRPPNWSFEWHAPAGCPDASEVYRRVIALAGEDSQGIDAELSQVRAMVEPRGRSRWRLVLEIIRPHHHGRRVVESSRCAELAEAASVLVSLSLDPHLALETNSVQPVPPRPMVELRPLEPDVQTTTRQASPPRDQPAPRATIVQTSNVVGTPEQLPALSMSLHHRGELTQQEPSQSRPRSEPRARGKRVRWHLGAGLGVDVGSAPAFGFAPVLRFGWEFNHVRVELVGAGWVSRNVFYPGQNSIGARLDLLTAGILTCVTTAPTRVGVGLCGGVETGVMRGWSFGVTEPATTVEPWFGLNALGDLMVPLGKTLRLHAQSGITIPVIRPVYSIEPLGSLFQASSVGFRAQIDLGFRF